MRNFLLKIIDPLLVKVNNRIEFLRKKALYKEKEEILDSFQSRGSLVRLNGDNFNFIYPQNIILANNIHIGNNAYFNASGGLIIGDNTHISRNVTIYTVNHNYKGRALPYDNDEFHKPVFIGKNVWIGMNVSILPGVTIGDGAIIGMGTVVNNDVKPLEIFGTSKSQKIGERDESHYNILNTNKSFGGINGRILSKKDIDNYKCTYEQNKEKPLVFILSTGRSGSKSIAHILNQNPKINAFHEDIPQLIRLSTELAKKGDSEKIFKELDNIFKNKIWQADNDEIIVHSDQRLWNFIPYLANHFPNSKFIHLVRNPHDSIMSMASRNWYQNDEYFKFNKGHWAKYRLQANEIGKYENSSWLEMSNIAKCTWYWYYINESISSGLSKLDRSDRFLKIKLRELPEKLNLVNRFLECGDFNYKISVINKRKAHHEKTFQELKSSNVYEQIEIELKKYNINFDY